MTTLLMDPATVDSLPSVVPLGLQPLGPETQDLVGFRVPSEVIGLQVEGVPLGRKLVGLRASQSLPSEACHQSGP